MWTPSREKKFFTFKTFDTENEIWERDQDFIELRNAENLYKDRIKEMIDSSKLDNDARENIICKIK